MRLSRPEVLVNFGFSRDPFDGATFETADQVRIRRILAMSIKSRAMISIIGDRGIGKTEAVKAALDTMNSKIVMVRPADKERLLISDIEQEMIYSLGDDPPRRGKVVRTQQLRRILGEAARKQEIVLVIEEGHRVHGQTLRSLKTLRELDWMGRSKLFSVILVGQSDPMNKPGVAEVRLRTDSVQMHGLAAQEVTYYVQKTVSAVFTDEAALEVSKQPNTSNFLDLQQVLISAMARALAAGRDKVEPEDVSGETASPRAKVADNTKTTASNAQPGENAVRSVLDRRQGDDQSSDIQATG